MSRLVARAVTAGYRKTPVVEEISLAVEPGRILTLLGPNGAGKSTLLRALTRQLAPLGGAVLLEEKDLYALPPREAARSLAILMTDRPAPELLTCWDIAATGRFPYTNRLGVLTETDREEVRRALALVGAEHLARREFRTLSDGQRQLILLARAICQRPRVLALDEPTSFLDVRHKLKLLAVLRDLARREGLAVILSLHELDLAQKVSDTLVCLREGRVDRMGPPEEIFRDGYLDRLYAVEQGSCSEAFGSLELEAPGGEPQVFVIGGGGSGISVYRTLQRQGIPFAAGVLHENDLDLPVARALATRVITEAAYEPISERALAEAAEVLRACRSLRCSLTHFGAMNAGNARLLDLARRQGIPVEESPC